MKPDRRLGSKVLVIRKTISLVVFALAALVSQLALADEPANPYDARVRAMADAVERSGRSPSAVLDMYRLAGQLDYARPGLGVEIFRRLEGASRLSAENRAYARDFLDALLFRAGEVDASRSLHARSGYVTNFRVIGGFDNEGKNGFDREMGPETNRLRPIDPEASFQGRERAVRWREIPEEVRPETVVRFDALLRPTTNVCAFAETFVEAERARPIVLSFGAGGATKLYWNGEEVHRDEIYRQAPDIGRVSIVLPARRGLNRLLIKECVTTQAWRFVARFSEQDGTPASNLRVAGAPGGELGPAFELARTVRPAESPFAHFRRRAEADTANAADHEAYARYLIHTGSDDPALRLAKQSILRAVELEPTVERFTLAISLAEERSEKQQLVDRMNALDAQNPSAVLATAVFRSQGFLGEDALHLLDAIPESHHLWLDAQILRAGFLRSAGFPQAALLVVQDAARRTNGAAVFLRALVEATEAAQRSEATLEARRALLAVAYDDMGTRRALLADALTREDRATVDEHLRVIEASAREFPTYWSVVASVRDALGDDAGVVAAYRTQLLATPDDASVHVALAQALLRTNAQPAAIDSLRRALALRPQDADTRELLEQLEPETRADEAFAASEEALLSRRAFARGYSTTTLEDLKVKTVYENGLASTFAQYAFEVLDADGARAGRSFSFQFDPETQRVEVRRARVIRRDGRRLEATQTFEREMGEPWYRIYYDTRAAVVVFPDLEVGDIVEIRYRIDDVAHRNVFADYFGDMHYWQSGEPTHTRRYVLRTPASREFYFNEPSMPTLTHDRRVEGSVRTDVFVATDVPAIVSEQGMPGITEVVPYTHVSTYRSWEDVGRWWWGLVRDQLVPNDALRRNVQEVVRGATTTREKVARIYDWVISNTRYVGLEFGIHGYLPYRVTQIVERGFGDCKDKASLLYVMLKEAGIDARIVLVRTRRNGDLAELPASLAVFDHAIAYVPELDLYLDGTAEFNGSGELPAMDQGVRVLVVGPEESRLARTPISPADRNRGERDLVVRLRADGSAEIDGEERIQGEDASGYRKTYEAEGTRRERFERAISNTFSGASVRSQAFDPMNDRERPIRFRYGLEVPSFASRTGTSLRIGPSVLSDLLRGLARTSTRRYPLELGSTASYIETRRIELADGLSVATLPAGGEIESPFGHIRTTYVQSGRTVETRVEFRLSVDRIEVARYADFRAWVERVDVLLRERVLVEGAAP
jgi:transglutaminase-like putative cysteine protease